MFQLFLKGGPMMWPLLLVSIVSVTVVMERLFFTLRESARRQPMKVEEMLSAVEKGDIPQALAIGRSSRDFVALALTYALSQRHKSFTGALVRAAGIECKRFGRGLTILDTAITLSPLMGLLGTVTGMIRAFGLLGAQELNAPVAITGGIAEALIATAFGLAIAIVSLLPFNFLNSRLEEARHEMEDAGTRLELLLHPSKDPASILQQKASDEITQ